MNEYDRRAGKRHDRQPLTEDERRLLREAVSESLIHAGINDPEQHRLEHAWAKKRIENEERRAEFWRKLGEDNARKMISAVFWFGLLALVLGASGAGEYVLRFLQKGG